MTPVKFRSKRHRSPFDSLFNDLFSADISQALGANDGNHYTAKVNITEREKDFQIELLVPGYSKKEIDISVEEHTLLVKAQKKNAQASENERLTRREFTLGKFERRFTLPEEVAPDKIKAGFENGILAITIPRTEKAEPFIRKISIG